MGLCSWIDDFAGCSLCLQLPASLSLNHFASDFDFLTCCRNLKGKGHGEESLPLLTSDVEHSDDGANGEGEAPSEAANASAEGFVEVPSLSDVATGRNGGGSNTRHTA